MTYNVFGGTLNLALCIHHEQKNVKHFGRWLRHRDIECRCRRNLAQLAYTRSHKNRKSYEESRRMRRVPETVSIPLEVSGGHLDCIRCVLSDWSKRCCVMYLIMRRKWVKKRLSTMSIKRNVFVVISTQNLMENRLKKYLRRLILLLTGRNGR